MPAATHHRRQNSLHGPKLKRLLIRPGAIGDVLVSLPALEWLGTEQTEIWTPANVASLIQGGVPLSSTGLDLLELGDGRARASLQRFDEIHSWYGAGRPEFREAVRDLPFVFHSALPDGSCHAIDFYSRQVGAADGLIPRIAVSREPSGFIACHPFSGSPKKNWPIENFLALSNHLPMRYCVGPEQSLEGALRIAALDELAAWLATADAYIGNDSGITHLAAAIGLPVIALFGPTDPAIWSPRGPHVRILHQDGLTPDSIVNWLDPLLQRAEGIRFSVPNARAPA